MKVFATLTAWQEYRSSLDAAETGHSIGLVPTMGALHAGHLALVRQCREENSCTVVSIFVNPTQFNQAEDLAAYPRDTDQDLAILQLHKVDAVFMPGYQDLYPDAYRYRVSESVLSQRFCGAHRPGRFDGVLTVVMKLLNIVRPDRAYFGEKDFQQLQLVRDMVTAFFLPVKIHSVPIVREADGLAMSSRNQRLDVAQRKKAGALYRALKNKTSALQVRLELEQAGFDVDYVEDFNGHRLAAASLGTTRLIDNVPLD